jgi:hypothetical protein
VTDQPETLCYRDVTGRLCTGEFTLGPVVHSPGAALTVRGAVDESGRHLVQKYVPRHLGRGNDAYYEALDRETRALTRLGQRFGMHYPQELIRIVGYNVDVEEPFVLLSEYRGQPVEEVYNSFDEDARRRFRIGLLRAVQHIGFVKVVHGALGMPSLRWDGVTVQLVDFESAGRAGEPRRADGVFPVRSQEQVAGAGAAHPGDDMWGVGLAFRQLVMGPHLGDGYPDLGSERLRAELAGLFGETAEMRPSAEQMLQRIRATSAMRPDPDPDELLRAGRQEFERASARKRGDAVPDAAPQAHPDPPTAATTRPNRIRPPVSERPVAETGGLRLSPVQMGLLVLAAGAVIAIVIFLVTR